MAYQILVVEDDTTLLEILQYNLERQGYEVQVAKDGRTGLNLAREHKPDLILLDVMLPNMDGFEVCRLLRKELNLPILMLTARTDEIDKIVGLELGADDYITKPFSMRELMARVKAHLRRVEMIREDASAEKIEGGESSKDGEVVLMFDNLIIDGDRREVFIDRKPVRLKPMEFELLQFLARNRGIALSRSLILERIWGWTFDGNSRTVDVHIRWLRMKIEPDPKTPVRIITVQGIGYRFDG